EREAAVFGGPGKEAGTLFQDRNCRGQVTVVATGLQARTEEQRRRKARETAVDTEGSTGDIRRSGTTPESRPTYGSAMPETEGRLFVRKSDGSTESFSREKLARSLVGAGAGRDDADVIAEQ